MNQEKSSIPGQGSLNQKTPARNWVSFLCLGAGILSVLPLLCTILIFPFGCGHYCGEVMILIFIALLGCALSVIFALPAITSGIVALMKIKKSGGAGKKIAIAGIVLGLMSMTIGVITGELILRFIEEFYG